ncbi:MAG: VTT domain-containing protein [Ruminococcus sp.]|nr:VTT domain-containing protein [Ruminococcus sp.]
MKGKVAERMVIGLSLIALVLLFVFFFKDLLVPLFSMQFGGDFDGAKELLESKGLLGGLCVILIEALQMVVVFIPAEFIQVSSGLSYPFHMSVILCDLGVCLGATLIFLLSRICQVVSDRSQSSKDKIGFFTTMTGSKSVMVLMYLLFITPIVPFGAICYYGSGTDISYRKYILTVSTGVIPSIITSNLIGTSAKAFIKNELPMWMLILIIVLLMLLLFVLLWFLLDKVILRGKDCTPDSAAYFVFFKLVGALRRHRQRLHLDSEKLKGVKGPYILLCNHVSFYDFYYVRELLGEANVSFVVNSHVGNSPILKRIREKAGMIPKKLFYPDTAALKMMRTLGKGYPVVVFPEGRLSIDGRCYPIVESAARIYKKHGITLVLANISGAYFANPKWRRKFMRSDIYASVTRVIDGEEMKTLSVEELEDIIMSSISCKEPSEPLNRYDSKKMAKGLENILYRCADCGELYTTVSDGNDLVCTACGKMHPLDGTYLFSDDAKSIPDYYDRIKELERPGLDTFELRAEVDTKIFTDGKRRPRKDHGECTLTKAGFAYTSEKISFTVPIEKLPALAFSCNEEFELYYNKELYYFYPVENRRQTVRWALLTDLLYEVRNGKEERKNADRHIP